MIKLSLQQIDTENTMLIQKQLCHKFFKNTSLEIHAARFNSLIEGVASVITGADLTCASLGRNMDGETKVKNKIKRSDRLLSNGFIYSDRKDIYKATTEAMLGNVKHIILIADWSPYQHKRDYGVFRIAAAFDGRSITVYQEAMEYNLLQKTHVQKRILETTKNLLPKNCKVTIISDMGFEGPWFKAIQALDWHYLGRLKIQANYKQGDEGWLKTEILDKKATSKPRQIANVLVFKTHQLTASIVYKRKNKKERKLEFSINPLIKQYQKAADKSWVLVTSLKMNAKAIVSIYAMRMQIETGFRDCKSHRFGLGLGLSLQKTNCLIRRNILLLIAHIALCILFIVGFLGEQQGWQYDFQANSIKTRRVLSFVFLGKEIIRHYASKI